MRNRAEKHAVRWCHLTHQFIAGASVYVLQCIPLSLISDIRELAMTFFIILTDNYISKATGIVDAPSVRCHIISLTVISTFRPT